jgi:propanediol utilization protein
VEIKVNDDYDWHMHIDTDEANAAGLSSAGANGEVIIR